MRKLLITLALWPFFAIAQNDLRFYLEDIKIIPSDFNEQEEKFKQENKETLHTLRRYIETKEEELDEIEDKIDQVEKDRSVNQIDTLQAQAFLNLMNRANENATIDLKIRQS